MTDAENSTATTAENSQPAGGGVSGSAVPEARFTQTDLDRIAGETRKSAREKAVADFLKELGVEKPEEAEALVSAAKAKADAEKTEAQKATEAAEKEKATRLALEQELAALKAAHLLEKRDNRVTALAREGGATVPEDVIAWAEKNASAALKAVTTDAGELDEKAAKSLIEAARKARPGWFKPLAPGSPVINGGRAVQAGSSERSAASAALVQRVRRGF